MRERLFGLDALRVIAPAAVTAAAIVIITLAPHSGTFALWVILPMNARFSGIAREHLSLSFERINRSETIRLHLEQ